jgi:hypothetical protein
MLQAGRSWVRIPMRSLNFSMYLPNAFSHTRNLWLTQSLTEMSIRNVSGGKAWQAHKADNLTAICQQMSRKCGILNVSQPYNPQPPVT